MKFTVTLEKDEAGIIVASVPALPGCHSRGKTEDQAIVNIEEAIRAHVASKRKHGERLRETEVKEVEVAD